ncbi:MAG: Nif11-like leader peptide family natural product precursor [Synechococcus sp. ChSW.bin.154]
MSESALIAFTSLVQSDSQLREKVRQAATPAHVVDLASEQGHEFNQATLMKMQAEKIKHLHDDHLNNASSWGEALLLCFGAHN